MKTYWTAANCAMPWENPEVQALLRRVLDAALSAHDALIIPGVPTGGGRDDGLALVRSVYPELADHLEALSDAVCALDDHPAVQATRPLDQWPQHGVWLDRFEDPDLPVN